MFEYFIFFPFFPLVKSVVEILIISSEFEYLASFV